MNQDPLEQLKQAVRFSPDNVPLRLHYAEQLEASNNFTDALEQYREILQYDGSNHHKFLLARCYFKLKQYSNCLVIMEEIEDEEQGDLEFLLLYAKCHLRDGDRERARELYEVILNIDPDFSDDELDNELRAKQSYDDDEEDVFENLVIAKPDVNFSHVGGMDEVKREIELKIVHPLSNQELYKAYGKKIGGGILLYGPPGCGKTFIARATAGEIDSKFLSVGLHDILDMWIGQSEKNLHGLFESARRNTPCVIFFDEIDALGSKRSDLRQSSGKNTVNQFLSELDGIESDNDGLLIIGATNSPWHMDSAFKRPGRFDRIIFVPPPDLKAREAIYRIKLKEKPVGEMDYEALAAKSNGFSGADITAVIDKAIENKLESAMKSGGILPLTTKDLLRVIKKHRPTTAEWFSEAKNFATFSNKSGLYDDVLKYLNTKR